jgi:hypothetical protein
LRAPQGRRDDIESQAKERPTEEVVEASRSNDNGRRHGLITSKWRREASAIGESRAFPAVDPHPATTPQPQRLMAMGHLGECICVRLRVLGTALGPFSHRALKVNLINLLTFKDWYWLTNLIFSKQRFLHHGLRLAEKGKLPASAGSRLPPQVLFQMRRGGPSAASLMPRPDT